MALALIGPGFASLVAIGATVVFVMLAKDVAAGEAIDASGRDGALKLLIAKVLDVIGMSGVLAIGGLALAGTLFWGYKRIKSPPILTTYELPASATGAA